MGQREYAQSCIDDGLAVVLHKEGVFQSEIELGNSLSPQSKIELKRIDWGIFDVGVVTYKSRQDTQVRSFYIGNRASLPYSFYFADNGKPLTIFGNLSISGGKIALPKSGFKREYVKGENRPVSNPMNGKVQTSQARLPEIDPPLIPIEKDYIDSNSDSLMNSFNNRTVAVKLRNAFISDFIKGNVLVENEGLLTLGAQSSINSSLLVTDSLHIQSGFKGNCQILCYGKVYIEENVILEYPSSITMLENTSGSNLYLASNSSIHGALISTSDNHTISLAEGSSIEGLVYSQGSIEPMGEIFGSLYAKKFIRKTASTFYTNYLGDSKVNLNELSEFFLFPPMLGHDDSENKVLKWLD